MTREIFSLFGPLELLEPGALRLISPTLAIELPHALSLACAMRLAEGTGRDVVFWQEKCPDRAEFRWCIATVIKTTDNVRIASGLIEGDVATVYTTRRSNHPTATVYLLTSASYEKAAPISASTFT